MKLRGWLHPPDQGLRFVRDPEPSWETGRVIGEVTTWTPGEGSVDCLIVRCPVGHKHHVPKPGGQFACGSVRWRVSG